MTSFARASEIAALVVAGALGAAPAMAQTPDKALAESLFQEGRGRFEAGDYAAACPKFAASQRVEPKLGTLLNLAACHEAAGKTASAWAEFTEASTLAARGHEASREAFARTRVDELGRRLSRVRVVTPDDERLVVSIDDVVIDASAMGTALPIDPGPHDVRAEGPGRSAWLGHVVAPEGPFVTEVRIPPQAGASAVPVTPAPPASGPTLAPSPPAVAAAPTAPDAVSLAARADPEPATSALTPIGWASIAAGALGLGLGSYFGLHAFAKKADGDGQCDALGCSQPGLDDFSSARSSATASTVAFAMGLAAIGAGVYLVVRGGTAHAAATASSLPLRVVW